MKTMEGLSLSYSPARKWVLADLHLRSLTFRLGDGYRHGTYSFWVRELERSMSTLNNATCEGSKGILSKAA